jgi:hypothetical protein
LHALAPVRAATPTLAFRAFFLKNEALNSVLHLRELSNQLDLTLGNSKKLALTWVATTQSDAIK